MTKSADVERAYVLTRARDQINDLRGTVINSIGPCVVRLDVGQFDVSGDGDVRGSLSLDEDTAKKVLDYLAQIIDEDLDVMGVTP